MSGLLFVTTVGMPLEVRAELDEVKARRAKQRGRRPSTRELIIEALIAFLESQRVANSTS